MERDYIELLDALDGRVRPDLVGEITHDDTAVCSPQLHFGRQREEEF